MKLIKVIPHGNLGEPMTIAANTAAEAFEGWSRQSMLADMAPSERPILEVIDFDTEEKLKAPLEVDEIHIAPAMFGGGPVGILLLGAGAIGIGAVGIFGAAISTALIAAGVSMVLGGIVRLFFKAPSLSREEDPEPSKYLGVGSNSTKIGTLMGIGGGRMMVGGHYLSLQVNSSDLVLGKYPENPT